MKIKQIKTYITALYIYIYGISVITYNIYIYLYMYILQLLRATLTNIDHATETLAKIPFFFSSSLILFIIFFPHLFEHQVAKKHVEIWHIILWHSITSICDQSVFTHCTRVLSEQHHHNYGEMNCYADAQPCVVTTVRRWRGRGVPFGDLLGFGERPLITVVVRIRRIFRVVLFSGFLFHFLVFL